MRLAAQLYTIRQFTNNEEQIYESLKKIKSIGYNSIQISAFGSYDPKNLKDILDELELKVCCTHTHIDRLYNDIDNVIKEHKLLEIPYIGLGAFTGKCLDDYKQFLKDINPSLNAIYKSGLKFAYHNHAHEFIKYDGIRPLDYIRDNTDKENFTFLADFYWIQSAGLSPIKFLKDYSGRVKIVHFKDKRVRKDGQKSDMAEIFEGNMNYEEIYKACLDEGVEWVAIEQDDCDNNPFESLSISYNNLIQKNMFL